MIAWLFDTLVMTGMIMAFVLVVRRPVGRWFGPGAAYALWALPMIRLFLPPLVLPESLALLRPAEMLLPPLSSETGAHTAAMSATHNSAEIVASQVPWGAILAAVWLGGAILFLLHRVVAYHVMRRRLLQDARSVGSSGKVRIVESWAVEAPVAFGVLDRVVALPLGFLATADSDASDFAITHELEHHAGNDLIANMAVQPLFALHWFNPLAWLAWRALRSDQEAACDARVMFGRTRSERERYGRLIASFAAGSGFALAAPMAGPLKGDKPIVHRLRALVRNDLPEKHQMLGRSLFAICVVAVPITASVTYAAPESSKAPGLARAFGAEAPLRSPALEPASIAAPAAPHRVAQVSDESDGLAASDTGAIPPAAVSRPVPFEADPPARPIVDEAAIEQQVMSAQVEASRARRVADRAPREAERAQLQAEGVALEAERAAEAAVERASRMSQSLTTQAEARALRISMAVSHRQTSIARAAIQDDECTDSAEPAAVTAVSALANLRGHALAQRAALVSTRVRDRFSVERPQAPPRVPTTPFH